MSILVWFTSMNTILAVLHLHKKKISSVLIEPASPPKYNEQFYFALGTCISHCSGLPVQFTNVLTTSLRVWTLKRAKICIVLCFGKEKLLNLINSVPRDKGGNGNIEISFFSSDTLYYYVMRTNSLLYAYMTKKDKTRPGRVNRSEGFHYGGLHPV